MIKATFLRAKIAASLQPVHQQLFDGSFTNPVTPCRSVFLPETDLKGT